MRTASGAAVAAATMMVSCGGGNNGTGVMPPVPPQFTSVPQVRVSQPPTLAPNCDGVAAEGTLYPGTAVEPSVAIAAANPANLIAAWQQDRWSSGGSQAIGIAASFDGGHTWALTSAAFSRCTGGSSANAGDYARASDPWVSISPGGVAYTLSLSFTGNDLAPGSSSAMLVARSTDGGSSWGAPLALIQDGSAFTNDKGSITADPTDNNFVYAVWDRLRNKTAGPTYFAVTANAGATWQPGRSIYDPGTTNQTLGNLIVVTPVDTLVNLFDEIDTASGGSVSSRLRLIRSSDHGTHWSAPIDIADILSVGTADPRNGAAVRDSAQLFTAAVSPAGVIYVAWQDARFSGGAHDGIALSHSSDDGLSWSTPIQVNAGTSVAAFSPTLGVDAGGAVAVTYDDLRNLSKSDSMLLADCWMVVSVDGKNFTESHMSGPFDLHLAPKVIGGYFLGDYQGMVSAAADFMPFYAQPDVGTTASTDVFISFPAPAVATLQAQVRTAFRARSAATQTRLLPGARRRIEERIRLVQRQRRHRA